MKLEDLKDLSKDDLLAAIGLQTKQSSASWVLGSLSIFGVGILVGAGAALLIAPKSGRELREDLGNRIRSARDMETSEGASREAVT